MIMAALGGTGVCYDLDCDGIVTVADVAIFQMHFGHACDDWIGTEESTWGAIKSIYR
jgi:hypothetical protein